MATLVPPLPYSAAGDAFGIATPVTEVIKRDGRRASWDPERITRAIALAFFADRHHDAPNPQADDAAARHGLGVTDYAEVLAITQLVVNTVARKHDAAAPTVEQLQDIVETMIAARGHWDIAKRYVLYRASRARHRLAAHGENGLQDYIFLSRYSRWRAKSSAAAKRRMKRSRA
jgi:ribonucleoside-triphosphate reductase (thioredoxin)